MQGQEPGEAHQAGSLEHEDAEEGQFRPKDDEEGDAFGAGGVALQEGQADVGCHPSS